MWLLNTTTAELRYSPDASHIERGGFAILSHTWGDNEQTFQDVQTIIEDCHKSGTNPRDHVSDKIRNCCILAERQGLEWVWIDTCCIDKTSSTEVSEAISSMYRWYEQADVCYAYLADVTSGDSLDAPDSEFRRSRWHTRGWTLQELIAPSSVLFYSKDWTFLGTRAQLSRLLFDITGVWPNILDRTWGVRQASIATRMHWASKRRTARVEDEAYCLLGLFGVDMPIMYGEGRRAFYRLQLEILRSSPDTSLFAWGPSMSQGYFKNVCRSPLPLNPRFKRYTYLLADSPADFHRAITCYTPRHSTPLQSRTSVGDAVSNNQSNPTIEGNSPNALESPEKPQFIITSQGMKCRLLIVEARGLTVAILFGLASAREHVGLCLTPVASSTTRYTVCTTFDMLGSCIPCRMLDLASDLHSFQLWGERVQPEWRTIYIDLCPPYWQQSSYGILPWGMLAARPSDVLFAFPTG